MSDSLKVRIFCPCCEAIDSSNLTVPDTLTLDTFPTTIFNEDTNHLLSYLTFCETCQAVKCRRCTELEIVDKYCPSCMLEMKPEYNHCSRNCFNCPVCDSHLNIHQKSGIKAFKFKCVSCDFQYETKELDKPKSLSKVLKTSLNETDQIKQFDELKEFYIQRKQLQLGLIDIRKEIILKYEKTKNKPNDINEFIRRSVIKRFNTEIDEKKLSLQQSSETNINNLSLNNSIDLPISIEFKDNSKLIPKPTRLRAKHSKRCKACRSSLMKPDLNPSSTKFYKLSNAIDYLPNLTIKQIPDLNQSLIQSSNLKYFLIFKNPTNKEIQLKISTFRLVPGKYQHKVNLPISNVKIGPKPDDASKLNGYIKTLSSLELTKLTKTSRVELMNRKITNPLVNFESIYEVGVNFIVIPIIINLTDSFEKHDLKIPLFISVKSEDFNYGYWSILNFGEASY